MWNVLLIPLGWISTNFCQRSPVFCRLMLHAFGMFINTHRIHGAAIYANIYHLYTPNVSIYIYTSTMDPMGYTVIRKITRTKSLLFHGTYGLLSRFFPELWGSWSSESRPLACIPRSILRGSGWFWVELFQVCCGNKATKRGDFTNVTCKTPETFFYPWNVRQDMLCTRLPSPC